MQNRPQDGWGSRQDEKAAYDTREMLILHRINPERWTAQELSERMGYKQEAVQRVLDGIDECLSR